MDNVTNQDRFDEWHSTTFRILAEKLELEEYLDGSS